MKPSINWEDNSINKGGFFTCQKCNDTGDVQRLFRLEDGLGEYRRDAFQRKLVAS